MADSHVYIRSKEFHWIPARVVEKKGDHVTVSVPIYDTEQKILSDGGKGAKKQERSIIDLKDYPNKVLPLQNVNERGWLNEEQDMVDLPFLHEAAILYNLKSRHVRGKPYTRTGDIVIAVNPYQWFHDLYTSQQRNLYSQKLVWDKPTTKDPRNELEPHVYESSALSYKGLAIEGMDQSILVSGESGAGKTETVKICMNHIAMIQAGPGDHGSEGASSLIVQRIVDSNPLLEAFGNAKTRRNDNSSRFGKYLSLQFEMADESKIAFGDRAARDCKLAGSTSEVYLLEKSRVVQHEPEERTYHIFYQLLAASDEAKAQFWPKLVGTNKESFKYVGRTDTNTIEGKSDAEHFQHTIESLALVDITGHKLNTLITAICVVMQLGNIGFDGDADKSHVSTTSELQDLAALMGVSDEVLNNAFTRRTMKTNGETMFVKLNLETAKDSCDALAKEIYHKAFLWLVNEINGATRAENNTTTYTGTYGIIGLLDIFGFESFKVNSFEQLCINYANEKLQQKFNHDIFRTVQVEYEHEGLAMEDITYEDNTDVLDLIESRLGLLAMLNEECVRPKGNDSTFVNKAISSNRDSVALIVEKRFNPFQFGIRHYAGDVIYNATSFVTKNNDTLASDLLACAVQSSNAIIAGEAAMKLPIKTISRRGSSNIAGATVWTKYRNGLHHLMGELRQTNSRYIRCIKPNEKKKPLMMQHEPTLDQLRSAGVISAITISRSAFPNRLNHQMVFDRFRALQKSSPKLDEYGDMGENMDFLLEPLLKHMEVEHKGRMLKAFAVGKTRTYFRAGALEYLEAERIKGFDPAAVKIQSVGRGFLVRKRRANAYIANRNAAVKIQSLARVLLAKGEVEKAKKDKKVRMRKAQEMRKKNKAATIINAIARGVVRRKRFRDELIQYREVTALKDQLKRLQAQVEESERLKQKAVKDAEERVASALSNIMDDETKMMENEHVVAENAAQLEERARIIEKLRAENKKVRSTVKMFENRYKRLREETKKLNAENVQVEKEFKELNDEAKRLTASNNTTMENQGIWKKQVTAMADELKRKQKTFMQVSESRVQYQTTLANIIKLMRTEGKDEQLIEDAIFIAFDCETEAKAQRAGFEAIQAQKLEKQNGPAPVPTGISMSASEEPAFSDEDMEMDDMSDLGLDEDMLADGLNSDEDAAAIGSDGETAMSSDDDGSPVDVSHLDLDEDELDKEAAAMDAELEALTAEVGS